MDKLQLEHELRYKKLKAEEELLADVILVDY